MTDNRKTLKLIPMEGSKEERTIGLTKEVAKLSVTLKDFLKSSDKLEEQPSISLPISVEIIDKIIAFLEYHSDDPIQDIDYYLDDNAMQQMNEWNRHLMEDLTVEKIFSAIAIADYLQIKGLTDVCKKTIDTKMKVLQILTEQLKQLYRKAFQSVSVDKNGQK